MNLKLTPLFREHEKLKAKMDAFAGWLMPIQYTGIVNEHYWTRQSCSLFDTCHMGELIIHGDLRESNLDKVVTQDLESMEIGKCSYGFMLNEQGGIIDDLVIYKLAQDKWMLVVNAGPLTKDEAHLRKYIKTELENISENTVKLDLQGPLSREVLKSILDAQSEKLEELRYYHFDYFSLLGEKTLISRTGYTGELGYELYVSSDKAEALWQLLLADERVKPAGLGARDTLRLEMGYPLYGEDITEDTTPLEAGLERFVDFKREFIGKAALLSQKKAGVKRKLTCFRANSRRAPRHNYKIYVDGQEIGFVTSGTFSPSLSCGIGMGYIETDYIKPGKKIIIREGKIEIEAVITERPFYREGSLRK
ncbi:MAG: glycine cleavage system aminomethyltransferase GcvT [Candidatus Desulfofervidaceae bacterium]|nr:glycine cleavage system aminomethyltransferase GcvT [Candidatus Desulfofervidaceae bacterium]